MRQFRWISFVALLAVACAAADTTPEAEPPPWAPEAPPKVAKEAIFLEIERGDLRVADGLLSDVWPTREAVPGSGVHLDWPLTWKENPGDDEDFRAMFYSLKFTSHLLHGWKTTGRPAYLEKLLAVLRSYAANESVRQYDGKGFDDLQTAAYRAIVLSNQIARLKEAKVLPTDLESRLRSSAARIADRLSDSANFEAASLRGMIESSALLVVANTFPSLPRAASLRQLALARLDVSRSKLGGAEGGAIEDSPFHQLQLLGKVAELVWWAERFEPELARSWIPARQAMLHYVAYATRPNGRLPMLGATGTTIVPNQPADIYGALAAYDAEYAWVWSAGRGGIPPLRRSELLARPGLYTLRSPTADAGQTFVTFDVGPYRPQRSHLDALGLTVFAEGATLFPDSGLYSYDDGPLQNYFHGTRAHNTVVVDGLDQAPGGATAGAFGVYDSAAWASGQSSLYSGVIHARTVVVLDQGALLVTDELESPKEHEYSQVWHTFAGAGVAVRGADVDVANLNKDPIALVRQSNPEGLEVQRFYGSTSPVQGWFSQAYGQKEPTHALEYRRRGKKASFATLIVTGRRARSGIAPGVWQTREGDTRVVRLCASGLNRIVRVTREGSVDAQVVVTPGGCP
jgi:hypothetical protein